MALKDRAAHVRRRGHASAGTAPLAQPARPETGLQWSAGGRDVNHRWRARFTHVRLLLPLQAGPARRSRRTRTPSRGRHGPTGGGVADDQQAVRPNLLLALLRARHLRSDGSLPAHGAPYLTAGTLPLLLPMLFHLRRLTTATFVEI